VRAQAMVMSMEVRVMSMEVTDPVEGADLVQTERTETMERMTMETVERTPEDEVRIRGAVAKIPHH